MQWRYVQPSDQRPRRRIREQGAVAAERPAAVRCASGVMAAHFALQIIMVVTVETSDQPSAVAIA